MRDLLATGSTSDGGWPGVGRLVLRRSGPPRPHSSRWWSLARPPACDLEKLDHRRCASFGPVAVGAEVSTKRAGRACRDHLLVILTGSMSEGRTAGICRGEDPGFLPRVGRAGGDQSSLTGRVCRDQDVSRETCCWACSVILTGSMSEGRVAGICRGEDPGFLPRVGRARRDHSESMFHVERVRFQQARTARLCVLEGDCGESTPVGDALVERVKTMMFCGRRDCGDEALRCSWRRRGGARVRSMGVVWTTCSIAQQRCKCLRTLWMKWDATRQRIA
jgi:hypothetical protein